MLDIPKFLYHEQPVFWYALAGTFFLFGLLYANAAWRSWSRRLRRGEREQLALLEERQIVIADRDERRAWTPPNVPSPVLTHLQPKDPASGVGVASLNATAVVDDAPTLYTARTHENGIGSTGISPTAQAPSAAARTSARETSRAEAIHGLFSNTYASGPAPQRNCAEAGPESNSSGQTNEPEYPSKGENTHTGRWVHY